MNQGTNNNGHSITFPKLKLYKPGKEPGKSKSKDLNTSVNSENSINHETKRLFEVTDQHFIKLVRLKSANNLRKDFIESFKLRVRNEIIKKGLFDQIPSPESLFIYKLYSKHCFPQDNKEGGYYRYFCNEIHNMFNYFNSSQYSKLVDLLLKLELKKGAISISIGYQSKDETMHFEFDNNGVLLSMKLISKSGTSIKEVNCNINSKDFDKQLSNRLQAIKSLISKLIFAHNQSPQSQ